MLLQSLTLRNIRSYTDVTIDFTQGSTLLSGDIGAGKTTILIAIEFALFGLMKGDISGSTLLRHGAKEGSVTLSGIFNEQPVTITRRLKRKGESIVQDSGVIVMPQKTEELTASEMRAKILVLLGYPQEFLTKNPSIIYRYTVYTPQEEMKTILFEPADVRMDILRKLFNIDKYKRVRENALEYAKELRTQKKVLDVKVQDIPDSERELQSLTSMRETLTATLTTTRKDYSEKLHELAESKNALILLQTEKDSYLVKKGQYELFLLKLKTAQMVKERSEKELNILQYRITEYQTRLLELEVDATPEETLRAELASAEEKLSKINTAKELITARIEGKTRDLQGLIIEGDSVLAQKQLTITTRLSERLRIEEELASARKEFELAALELARLFQTTAQSKKLIEQISGLNTCPVCLQTVDLSHKVKITDREHALQAELLRKTDELEQKRHSAESKIVTLQATLESLHKLDIELEQIRAQRAEITRKQELKLQLEKELAELSEKKQKLDQMDVGKLVDFISKQRKILGSFELRRHLLATIEEKKREQELVLQDLNRVVQEIVHLEESKSALEKELASAKTFEQAYICAQEKHAAIQIAYNHLELTLAMQEKEKQTITERITAKDAELQAKRLLAKKSHYIAELQYWITEHFINVTATIEHAIMTQIHSEFSHVFREWFSMLLEDETITVSIDHDFTPRMIQNTHETSIENLSGGEKTAIALAYRLALHKTVNEFISTIKTSGVLILDEPTDGFSAEQLDKLQDVIQTLAVKQLILVSHETKLESYVERIIRVTKEHHTSSITL